MESNTLWRIVNKYFEDNPQYLVAHHIESYNDFFHQDIFELFKNQNPIQITSAFDERIGDFKHKCNLYIGGRTGRRVYFGKPMIHDADRGAHYMYPNEARIRNMTYGMTVHFDVEVEFIDILSPGESPYVVGPEFLDEEEVAKLGEISGGAVDEFDVDYSDAFQREADEKPHNYKIDGGDHILQQLERESGGSGGARKPKEPVLQGDKKEGAIAAPTNKRRDKKAESERKQVKMTTAMAAATKEAQARSVTGAIQRRHVLLKKLYLGKIPIMVQSDFCILNGMPRELRHSFGECRNDPGGYFIINGKEKTISVQEKFGDNMLYIRKGKVVASASAEEEEMVDDYLYSAEIRSVSENVAKPKRTMSVKLMAPSKRYTNRNIMVFIPNVRAPIPLFILFRALGVLSDKDIISMCVLDLDKYDFLLDLFEPSVHDAGPIMQQHTALKFIGELTKFHNEKYALEILTDYFLPHVGETNYMEKAYYLGHMVFRLLCASAGLDAPTDRDNLKYKRLEPFGKLFNDLFMEYYVMQQKHIYQEFDRRIYFNNSTYEHDLPSLIFANYREIFGERIVDNGLKKAFKGAWGAQAHTRRVGIVQDLNRISFNAALCHLRKINLPLDSTSKVVGPRILHNSHWGYFDFIDTPDGANIGLHKTFAMTAYMTRGYSREPMIQWMRENVAMCPVTDFTPIVLSTMTKVFVNGHWAGVVETPFECVSKIRFYRRNGLLPLHTSVAFNIRNNAIEVYTDAGRFTRPIFYRDDISGKWAFLLSKSIGDKLESGDFSWEDVVSGFNDKRADLRDKYKINDIKVRSLSDMYPGVGEDKNPAKFERFLTNKSIIEYIDPNETEHSLIAQNWKDWENNPDKHSRYTHMEIHHSFLFGIMCNQSIFAETNPAARISFSCSQSRQACSVYHSNFHVRMDKTAIVLNYGQTPLLKTRLLQHIDREEHPYGENVIVAIMCYTGYNVEDAILVNEGAIQRGLFNTTYYTVYSEHEERKKEQYGAGQGGQGGQEGGLIIDKRFTNIENEPNIVGLKPGHDYSKLDRNGLIKENTPVDDKTIIIGYTSNSAVKPDVRVDGSKTTKKGQLGVVDKAFITEGEEGERIAKVRIREIRIPNLGDKMASRAGQKGVVGLVIPESDMPFTKDGLKPDLIINPHALPTRQTIGHLVECLIGKVCTMYGGFSDCTAFNNEGSKAALYGRLLPEVGFHSSGHDIMYNGMTGEQIETEIFIGPNYYMRLKHMVKDKINYRALGPRTALTKQPVSGRANDGGLRIGEMERDSLLGHGISEFLRESMMERGDEYQMVVCNTTGVLAVYNKARDLFMSPMADGPLRFFRSETGKGFALDTMTKYGRRFSVVSIPYSLKLLIQELAAINIQLRIITEDNLPQIDSMAFSDNLNRLTLNPDMTPDKLVKEMERAISTGERPIRTPDQNVQESPESIIQEQEPTKQLTNPQEDEDEDAEYTAYKPRNQTDIEKAYEPTSSELRTMNSSPGYIPGTPNSEEEYQPISRYSTQDSQMEGGSYSQTVNDFALGEQLYFTRSVDLGLPHNHIWRVAKKGGSLLTLTTDRGSIMGGGAASHLTKSDLVQIAGANELIKPDAFLQWEERRAQQQYMMGQNGGGQNGMGPNGMGVPPQTPTHLQPQVPQINIKMVGGNDFSRGEQENAGGQGQEINVPGGGGGTDSGVFNNLVIPNSAKQLGRGFESSKNESQKPEKTIMGGLADFGSLVINKIM
jgi:DNA-directed RNA polymerase II subunit RPB2